MDKKGNKITGIIVAVVAFVVAFIIGFSMTSNNKADNKNTNNNSNESTTSESVESVSTKDFEYKGYTFTIPSHSKASDSGNNMLITAHDGKYVIAVIVQDGKYSTMVARKDQLQDLLKAQESGKDYDMSNAVTEEKTYGQMPFLIVRDISNGEFILDVGYGKADENNLFVVSVTKSDGTKLTDSERQELYEIVATGK